MLIYDTIVIGGGPSGAFCSINLGKNRNNVLLLEKNNFIGKKLLVAGQGKCNLTNSAPFKSFFNAYGDNGKFLKDALYSFKPEDLISWFEKSGLPLTLLEDSGKYFPHTFSSKDVITLLETQCKKNKVEVKTNSAVTKISCDGNLFKVITEKDTFYSKTLVVATGGKSYPGTGTTGDGYTFAKMLDHNIIEPKSSLAPIFIDNYPFTDLSGVSFQNIKIKLWRENKLLKEKEGALLLTHHNLSGPLLIDLSRYIKKGDKLAINFLNLSFEDFNSLFLNFVEKNGKFPLKTFFSKNNFNLPERFLKKISQLLQFDLEKKLSEISKKERESILKLVSYEVFVTRLGDFNIAMATSGGVNLNEINSKTLESKKIKGLYFVGEVLDIDGDTGGYNIQAAFSTGYLAANSILKNKK